MGKTTEIRTGRGSSLNETIQRRIRIRLDETGKSLKWLTREAGVSEALLLRSRLKKKDWSFSFYTIIAISRALDVPIPWLIGKGDETTQHEHDLIRLKDMEERMLLLHEVQRNSVISHILSFFLLSPADNLTADKARRDESTRETADAVFQRIRRAAAVRRMTYHRIGKKLGLSDSTVSSILKQDGRRNIHFTRLLEYIGAVGLSPEQAFNAVIDSAEKRQEEARSIIRQAGGNTPSAIRWLLMLLDDSELQSIDSHIDSYGIPEPSAPSHRE